MNLGEVVDTLEIALLSLDEVRVCQNLEAYKTLSDLVDTQKPGTKNTLLNRAAVKLTEYRTTPESLTEEEFLQICQANAEVGLSLAWETWLQIDQVSFLEACGQDPLLTISICGETWNRLAAAKYKKGVIDTLPLSLKHAAGTLSEHYPELLLKACDSYIVSGREFAHEQWSKLDPEGYVKNCQQHVSETLANLGAALAWKSLDEEIYLKAIETHSVLTGVPVNPEVLKLVAERNPGKVLEYLRTGDYVSVMLENPDLWWNLDEAGMVLWAYIKPSGAQTLVPYMLPETQEALLELLKQNPYPDVHSSNDIYRDLLRKTLGEGTWEESTLEVTLSETTKRLLAPIHEGKNSEWHKKALMAEIDKAKEMGKSSLAFKALVRYDKAGELDELLDKLPGHLEQFLKVEMETLKYLTDDIKVGPVPDHYRDNILGKIKAIYGTLQTLQRNKSTLLHNLLSDKTPLSDEISFLLPAILNEGEILDLTKEILNTPGITPKTLTWATLRAGNLTPENTNLKIRPGKRPSAPVSGQER
jgi:hypothetical protein